MPIVAGIALTGLAPGSAVFAEILSSEDKNFVQSFHTELSGDLASTFKQLATSFPETPLHISLSLPTFLSREERKSINVARRSADWPAPVFSENKQLAHIALGQEPQDPRNDLLVEVTSTVANCRLVSSYVEEGIRDSTTIKEFIDSTAQRDTEALVSQIIATAATALQQEPSEAGKELQRIVIIDANNPSGLGISESQVTSERGLMTVIKVDYPTIARAAAQRALSTYQSSISKDLLIGRYDGIFIRTGIVKADGFVHTVIPRGAILPQSQSAFLTTSKDGQTKVTISVVLGISPLATTGNLEVATLVLEGLPPGRPAGVPTIRVTIEVDDSIESPMRIWAEDVDSSIASEVFLKNFIGNLDKDEVEELMETWVVDGVVKVSDHEYEAARAEKIWDGQNKQGALPE